MNDICLYRSSDDYFEVYGHLAFGFTENGAGGYNIVMRRQNESSVLCNIKASTLTFQGNVPAIIWLFEPIANSDEEFNVNQGNVDLKLQLAASRIKKLEQANWQLETILLSSPLATYSRDMNSRVLTWNPAAEKIFGWKAEEVLGKQIPTIPKKFLHEGEDLRERILSGDTILEMEVVRQCKNKKLIDISMTIAPLKDSSGVQFGYLTIAADISARKEDQRKISHLAYHDALTGLPNRLNIRQRFNEAVARSNRSNEKAALLLIDFDQFKIINDSLGYSVGDGVIAEVSKRLVKVIRSSDSVGRLSGDEFLVVLGNLKSTVLIEPILTKILRSVEEPFMAGGREVILTASIGISVTPIDGVEFEAVLKRADVAMLRAKELGRNTYQFYDDSMQTAVVDRLRIQTDLRHALDREEFVLAYQPQVSLKNNAIIGVEVLVRWNHPQTGLVMPGQFIAAAEESGLIVEIGEWVLNQACKQMVSWQQAGIPRMILAVNLSVVQFKRGNLTKMVLKALQESGLDPNLLELELTESILIHDADTVKEKLSVLKQMGVKLSIDDFGTGYSSLSYLKHLKVDKLKIDQSFVKHLATDQNDRAIVKAIIQMAHGLNLVSIAEGVETPVVLDQLNALGCNEAQGYLFAKPMLSADFESYMRNLPKDGRLH